MNKERLLSDYVHWRSYVADDVILLDNNSVMMMIGVDGLPFETTEETVLWQRHWQFEAALRTQAVPGLIYHFLQCRGTADADLYPTGSFRTEFAERFDQRYRYNLFGTRSMWLNQTYLAVILPPQVFGGSKFKRLHSKRGLSQDATAALVTRLRRIVGVLMEELRLYHPKIQGVVRRGRQYFTEIGEAIAFAMTGYWRPVPMTVGGPKSLFSEIFFIGHEAFELRMPHASAFGACLGFEDYPYETGPGMFDKFLSAKYRHTVFHAIECMASVDGLGLANRKQNYMRAAGDRAVSQADALTSAADLIASNRLGVGRHASALTLFVDDRDSLPAVVQQAWKDLSTNGIKVERETLTLESVLFSQVPGNFEMRGRQAAISSRNFAAVAALHNYPQGDSSGFWGQPFAMLRTSGGTPYLFHLHHGGVGNVLVSGESGSGKTVILGWIICMSERFDAQVVLWDKDRGLESLVRSLEGSYLSLTNIPGLGTGLAPLKRLSHSEADLAFLSGLIRACISTPSPYEFTPEEDRRLGIALRHVMSGPPEQRNLSEIRAFLGCSRGGAGARLEKWCKGGEFGWVIDCDRDIVSLDNKVLAFDQTDLLEDPIASGAVIATLFHYTGSLVDGRPLIFVLDEIWNLLTIEQFLPEIKNGLKTWRKFNSPVIAGTQGIDDALNSPIGSSFRQQTPTQIYFSNPGASWADHGPLGMNLTPTEFDIIQKLPKGSGFFLLRQGRERSVVVQVPLAGMDEVKVISGTRRGSDAIKLARERTGDAVGAEFSAAYLRALEELV
jgi:type IV secretion system protein VirB4